MNPLPETHFDKKLFAGILVFLIVSLLLYVRFSTNAADMIIGGFIGWIGGTLGVLGNIVTGRPTTRTGDKDKATTLEVSNEAGTASAQVKTGQVT